jgi:hypothetical protein
MKYVVDVSALVTVDIDLNELSEDEDEHSLIFRYLEENCPELRHPAINKFTQQVMK